MLCLKFEPGSETVGVRYVSYAVALIILIGEHCFKGHRHSLCHGWAGGVTAWLSKHVLGIKILEAGFKKISVEPFLGDLEYVEGTYPIPQGQISVRHIKETSNKITTKVDVPAGIEVQLL